MMQLDRMMEQGILRIMQTAGRFYLGSAKGRQFLAEAVPALKRSVALRQEQATAGLHVPPFLIASIASRCNLRCSGCYARAGDACGDAPVTELGREEWRAIFAEATGLGVSFILLAGGEPLLRRDILDTAAGFPGILFPVFTNGTLLDGGMLDLFDEHRNLVPLLSIEGGAAETDARRGSGTYACVTQAMEQLRKRRILFGVSVTATRENVATVTARSFAVDIREKGAGLLLYVEYVPAEAGTEHLVLEKQQTAAMLEATTALKGEFKDMIVLSFPGDEAAMGGCLASGRGFFHIAPGGAAEPCPFSPYSRHNLRDSSIEEILRSEFFAHVQELARSREHDGGCALFACEEQVARLVTRDSDRDTVVG